jgi:hypothetical protein
VVKRFAADRENSVTRTVLMVKRGRIHGAHVAGAHAMDCTDCHNRTGHAFDPPSRSLDRVLSEDTLSPSLPFIKRAGLELLLGRYAGRAEALTRIRAGLARFYRERDPETYEKRRAEIGGAAEVLAGIYQREWGDYPDNLGHTRFPGCFRCHDGRQTSPSGVAIPGGCQTCHETLVAASQPWHNVNVVPTQH